MERGGKVALVCGRMRRSPYLLPNIRMQTYTTYAFVSREVSDLTSMRIKGVHLIAPVLPG